MKRLPIRLQASRMLSTGYYTWSWQLSTIKGSTRVGLGLAVKYKTSLNKLDWGSTWVDSGLALKFYDWRERVSKDKHSTLLGLIISNEGKKFNNIDTWWPSHRQTQPTGRPGPGRGPASRRPRRSWPLPEAFRRFRSRPRIRPLWCTRRPCHRPWPLSWQCTWCFFRLFNLVFPWVSDKKSSSILNY